MKRIKELEQANRELGDTNNKIIEENILFNRKKEQYYEIKMSEYSDLQR